ncbi:hypothetical protein [Flavobacterium sp. MK4S-17]|uniref:hypothetical protein n=1 Tax=Flavobacterium sp. MK4S-17 TaxID=2543737 RepID=UPI00135C924E|nr:hypothetical protein [Flavobacterium sp. MK4S-17]
MKRKFALLNLLLMAVVLLTTAYQSFHALSHSNQYGHSHEKHEDEKVRHFGTNHTHEHEDCSICDFHFDFFVAPQQFCLRLDFPFQQIHYTFSTIEGSPSFAGSLFAHRGPPVLV